MKYLLPILFTLLFSSSLRAQVRFYDSSRVSERMVDTVALNEYANDKDFQYDRNRIEGPGLLDQLASWILEKLFGSYSPGDVNLFNRILLISIVVIALGLIIFYFSKISRSRITASRGQNINQVQFLDFEGSSADLDSQWNAAEKERNFPLALRFLFIKTLFYLKEINRIVWKKEKTNRDYINELKDQWEHGPFEELSYLFTYTQYGGYDINESDYLRAKSLYQRLIINEKGDRLHG